VSDAIIWHDVENGGYEADLGLWHELAAGAGGPILDLGAGTGRVALALAEAGHDVTALDSDGQLLDELAERAGERGLRVECLKTDARELQADRSFALVLAPMQFVQILAGAPGRAAVLERVAGCLQPGGTFAAAIANLDEAVAAEDAPPPVPDVGQRGDWIYSSLPLDVRPEPGGVAVEWLRQRVSPAGELTEELHTQLLDAVSPEQLELEAEAAGLRPVERRAVPETDAYIGSVVVVCRR
jgi:ubiquinone/menaquinone biosynthesis C-methylase UbiE